jgi:coproporphyrinogen III oxidase-like Fe-S oxidoreductase
VESWDASLSAEEQPELVKITPIDRLLEDLMLGLRLAEGVAIEDLVMRHGGEVIDRLRPGLAEFVDRGWVLWDDSRSERLRQRLRLSDPEGFLFSNQVLATIFELVEDYPIEMSP